MALEAAMFSAVCIVIHRWEQQNRVAETLPYKICRCVYCSITLNYTASAFLVRHASFWLARIVVAVDLVIQRIRAGLCVDEIYSPCDPCDDLSIWTVRGEKKSKNKLNILTTLFSNYAIPCLEDLFVVSEWMADF